MANFDAFFFFFKDCVTKLSILDILEGPGNLRHQSFISFVYLLSLWCVLSFYFPRLSEEHRLGCAGTCTRSVTALLLEDSKRGWADSSEALFCFEGHVPQGSVNEESG